LKYNDKIKDNKETVIEKNKREKKMKNVITYGFRYYWSNVIHDEKNKIISENKSALKSSPLSDEIKDSEDSEDIEERDEGKDSLEKNVKKITAKKTEILSVKNSDLEPNDSESLSNISGDEESKDESEKSEDSESEDLKINVKKPIKSVDLDEESTEETSEEVFSVDKSLVLFFYLFIVIYKTF
jgi:hypothetical protein